VSYWYDKILTFVDVKNFNKHMHIASTYLVVELLKEDITRGRKSCENIFLYSLFILLFCLKKEKRILLIERDMNRILVSFCEK